MENKRYFEKGISNKLGDKFAEEFEKLCESCGFSDSYAILRLYDILREQYDMNDAKDWLLEEGLDSLAKNEEFLESFIAMYNDRYDSEYGTWDNMSAALDWMADTTEWADTIAAAQDKAKKNKRR